MGEARFRTVEAMSRALFVMLILLCLCLAFPAAAADTGRKTIVIMKQADHNITKEVRATFSAEVVTEKEDQQKGLSGRESIPADAGMLFVLAEKGPSFFWMKGMNFPIDIIVFDRGMKTIEILRDLRPCMQCPVYGVSENAAYALEINAGLAAKYGIEIGDRLMLK